MSGLLEAGRLLAVFFVDLQLESAVRFHVCHAAILGVAVVASEHVADEQIENDIENLHGILDRELGRHLDEIGYHYHRGSWRKRRAS